MPKLIFGCGYLGSRVAELWRAAGDTVCVVTRRAERAVEFERAGFSAVVADVTDPRTLSDLPAADLVLFAVGYDRKSGKSIAQVYVDGFRQVLDGLPARTGRVIYISSTGVYGQTDGRWVDEDDPCEPTREGGRACLAAESVLLSHDRGNQATILRLAGIYGPGRVPRIADLRAGKPIPGSCEGYLNLIHVDDAAVAVAVVEKRVGQARIYNVSDGHPVVRREYFEEVARQIAAPPPIYDQQAASDAKRQRGESNKRVSNRRLVNEFDFKFRYPNYSEGLRAILAEAADRG